MLNIFSLGGARKKPKREGKSRNKKLETNTHTQNPDQTSPPSIVLLMYAQKCVQVFKFSLQTMYKL